MINEKSLANLHTNQPFSSENQPEYQGRPKGVRNRRTLFKEWLATKTVARLPDGQEGLVSLQDQIVLAMIDKARRGDVNAAILVLDSTFGKIANVNVTEKPIDTFDTSNMSEAELLQIEAAGAIIKKHVKEGYEDAHIVHD